MTAIEGIRIRNVNLNQRVSSFYIRSRQKKKLKVRGKKPKIVDNYITCDISQNSGYDLR